MIPLLIIALVLLVLLLLPLGVRVRYDEDGLFAALKIGPVLFRLFPPRENKKPKKEKKSKEDKPKQAEEHPKRKGGALALVKGCLPLVKPALEGVRKRLTIRHLELHVIWAATDPADPELLRRLLEAGIVPVFCAIMHDGRGSLLNCNADSVASAVALGAARIAPSDLVFCFEKRGVLRDPDNDASVIPEITAASFEELRRTGVVSRGMLPKIENALRAVADGVRSVVIKHADDLLSEQGTVIR